MCMHAGQVLINLHSAAYLHQMQYTYTGLTIYVCVHNDIVYIWECKYIRTFLLLCVYL